MRQPLKLAMIFLTGAMFLAEVLSSSVTRSLTLLISAYHMLYNLLSFLLLFATEQPSPRKCAANTYGWSRLVDFGNLFITLLTGSLCLTESTQLVQILLHESHKDKELSYPGLILILGVTDFTLNILCYLFVGGYTRTISEKDKKTICNSEDRDMKSCEKKEAEISASPKVFPDRIFRFSRDLGHKVMDVSLDVSSCLLVIVYGSAILLSDACGLMVLRKYIDAALALLALTALAARICPRMKKCALIALQTIPNHMDVENLKKKLEREFPNVLDIHDFHVWQLSSTELVATLHIIIMWSETVNNEIVELLNRFFCKEGIKRVTVQLELTKASLAGSTESKCLLQCSSVNKCVALTCCGQLSDWCTQFHNGPDSKPERQDTNEDVLPFTSAASNFDSSFPASVTDSNTLGSCGSLTNRKPQYRNVPGAQKSFGDVPTSTTSKDNPPANLSAAESDALSLRL